MLISLFPLPTPRQAPSVVFEASQVSQAHTFPKSLSGQAFWTFPFPFYSKAAFGTAHAHFTGYQNSNKAPKVSLPVSIWVHTIPILKTHTGHTLCVFVTSHRISGASYSHLELILFVFPASQVLYPQVALPSLHAPATCLYSPPRIYVHRCVAGFTTDIPQRTSVDLFC